MFSKKKTNQEEKENAQTTEANEALQGLNAAQPLLRDENTEDFESFEDPEDLEQSVSSDDSESSDSSNSSEDPESSEKSEISEKSQDSERIGKEEIERAYCLGAGIDDETFARVKGLLEEIAESVYGNKFNPETIRMAMKAMNYDNDLSKAHEEGLALGRSEAIAETFRNRRCAAGKATEIPHFKGSKGIGNRLQGNSIFEVARGAKG